MVQHRTRWPSAAIARAGEQFKRDSRQRRAVHIRAGIVYKRGIIRRGNLRKRGKSHGSQKIQQEFEKGKEDSTDPALAKARLTFLVIILARRRLCCKVAVGPG